MSVWDIVYGWDGFWQFVALWCALHIAYQAFKQVCRVVRIGISGWPPPHCNADGDMKGRDEE